MVKNCISSLLLCLLSISEILGQSCLCDPQDTDGMHQWYEVLAPSGLVLREGPDRNTTKLGVIPFGEEILSCRFTNNSEWIEGKSGTWVKVTWADKTGYVFSGFLKEIKQRKIRLVMPNSGVDSDWNCMTLSPEMQWNALVDTNTNSDARRNNKATCFSTINLKIGKKKLEPDVYCSSAGYLNNAILNAPTPPFAVFSGFDLTNNVINLVQNPIKLLPGELASFILYDRLNQKERRYVIAAEGNVLPNPNFIEGDDSGPIDRIEHYKINMYQQINTSGNPDRSQWNVQKLADGQIKRPTDTDTHKMDVPYIYFAGDLDGDNQLDLILAKLTGVGHAFQLYLSSKKLPEFFLRYVAQWTDSGC